MRWFKKTAVEFEKESVSKPKKKVATSKVLINPYYFSRDYLFRQLPFFCFLAFLAFIYISSQYNAEKVVNEIEKLKSIRSEKRAEKIAVESNLMMVTRQSQVLKLLNEKKLDLKPLNAPPKKIMITKSK